MSRLREICADKKVVVVEDDDLNNEIVCNYLRLLFKEVYSAKDGKSGLEIILREKPDVVFTDIAMPVMNGVEMVEEMLVNLVEAEVIVMTAYRNEYKMIDSVKFHLYKPLDIKEINNCLISIFEEG